jgi:hypothetical protein
MRRRKRKIENANPRQQKNSLDSNGMQPKKQPLPLPSSWSRTPIADPDPETLKVLETLRRKPLDVASSPALEATDAALFRTCFCRGEVEECAYCFGSNRVKVERPRAPTPQHPFGHADRHTRESRIPSLASESSVAAHRAARRCVYCPEVFATVDLLKRHLIHRHHRIVTAKGYWGCRLCFGIFPYSLFAEHATERHPELFCCPICMTMMSLQKAVRHLSKHAARERSRTQAHVPQNEGSAPREVGTKTNRKTRQRRRTASTRLERETAPSFSSNDRIRFTLGDIISQRIDANFAIGSLAREHGRFGSAPSSDGDGDV